jgi:hypothetical protein
MSFKCHRVTRVSLPSESRIAHAYLSTDYADAYSVELPSGASTDPERLARFIFEQPSPLSTFLLKVRDVLVGGLGLKTARNTSLNAENNAPRLAIFRIYSISQAEIVLGEDDKHLDFRVSVLCSDQQSPEGKRHVTLSTVIHCHNRFGRFYFFVIAPFHRFLVQSGLRRAARIGWPSATEAASLKQSVASNHVVR